MRFAWLALCAFTGASFAFDSPKTAPPPIAAAPKYAVLDKVAVIGASMSAGFRLDGNTDSFGPSKIQLANVIEASLKTEHQPVVNGANGMFVMDRKGSARTAMALLQSEKPTLVVALDYLFWFGYGMKKEDQRCVQLDAALAELGAFTCPILLGDLPDMATAATVPEPMLQKSMVPAPDTLKTLNEHILAFAKEHKNIVVVPLADITAKLESNAEVVVRDNKWPQGSVDVLMQKDRLHPTLEGTCAVWVVALDAWLKAQKDVPATAFELDAAKLMASVKGQKPEPVPSATPPEKPARKPGEKQPAPPPRK